MITDRCIIPAGKYLFGDPCYFVPHDDWGPLIASTDCFRDPGHVRGMIVVAYGTAYGDGEYLGSNGFVFPVDAGLLGVTDARLCQVYDNHLGMLIDIKEQTELVSHDNGERIELVGYVTIDTVGCTTCTDNE